MPVMLHSEYKFCHVCDKEIYHTVQEYGFPEKKIVKRCRGCGTIATYFIKSEAKNG